MRWTLALSLSLLSTLAFAQPTPAPVTPATPTAPAAKQL